MFWHLRRHSDAILGRPLDKAAFRRRLRESADLEPVEGAFELGRQRPAQLYRASRSFRF